MDGSETTKGTKRPNVDRSAQRKNLLHFWFKILLLFCVVAFLLCYTFYGTAALDWASSPFQKHYQRFFGQKKNPNPPYAVHWKHSARLSHTYETSPKEIQETKPTNIQETTPRKIQVATPKIIQVATPKIIQVATPKIIQVATPKIIQVATPKIIQVATPKIIQVATPKIIQVATPAKPVLPTVPPVQYHQAYPRNYHFIMDNTEVCKTKKPFLVLMVPVAPSNVAARDAIRHTWGNSNLVQGQVVLTLFMLGLPSGADIQQQQEKLKQENQPHLDLIQSNFRDTYLNLTIKTMVIMDWLATRCPEAAYAMKIDSDMFLNIDNLVLMLQKPGIPKTNYLTGRLMWNIPVIRSKSSKWYVPEELYPDGHYPTYALGMGYLFSNDLPEKFVQASKSIKPFNIEDAYIGMCMKNLGFPLTPPPDAGQFRAYNSNYNRCEYSKIITYILGSSQQLVDYWTDLKKPGPAC